MKVGRHPLPQVPRLADVEHLFLVTQEAVNARKIRQAAGDSNPVKRAPRPRLFVAGLLLYQIGHASGDRLCTLVGRLRIDQAASEFENGAEHVLGQPLRLGVVARAVIAIEQS